MLQFNRNSSSDLSPAASAPANIEPVLLPHPIRLPNSHTTDNMPYLFQLPRELRNLIYHELWQMTPRLMFKTPFELLYRPCDQDSYCRFRHPLHRIPTYFTPRCIRGLPLWLLTCTVLLSEGLEQQFRRAVWVWSVKATSPTAEYLLAKTNPLARLSTATSLSIFDSHEAHKENGSQDRGNIVIEYSKHRLREMDHLLPPKMKALRLDLVIEASAATPIDLDLSALKPSGLRLQRVAFTFKLELWTKPPGTCEERYTTFLRDAKIEASRVGRRWLCEEGERELEMSMETALVRDNVRPRLSFKTRFQNHVIQFEVARKGMLKVARPAKYVPL